MAKSSVRPNQVTDRRPRFEAQRTVSFTESVIREMTRLAQIHTAVNLAQGFPDFPAPADLKEAACRAINDDQNQYSITWGAKNFRQAIAAKYRQWHGLELDPEREITVCCGATEGMIATLLAVTNPGDEVIVFEPYYENYHPDTLLCGATRRIVSLQAPDWTFDPAELRQAFNARTKAIIINSPNNPTGKVFGREELELIASLCEEHDCLAITDEIYEHILFDGATHIPPITLANMRHRSVLINSMSKTYSVTGWRVGWVIASPDLSASIRKVHDFLTVGAATPLQQAGVHALSLPESYYAHLSTDYVQRRDAIVDILKRTGFKPFVPRGAYYVMADISAFGFPNDQAFAAHLVENIGVAAVPGSSFFENAALGSQLIRFCFCKKFETLHAAEEKLSRLAK
ncbi:MAG: aminotransferase class I/II-fold pyridoxal phosphate-dependent enzyme [Bryobacteraceae bacterium]|nr:aminotransferase class I/II-fold pyridoxal phosphate-dependent enzyme [Bryobacteraceae bacterium]